MEDLAIKCCRVCNGPFATAAESDARVCNRCCKGVRIPSEFDADVRAFELDRIEKACRSLGQSLTQIMNNFAEALRPAMKMMVEAWDKLPASVRDELIREAEKIASSQPSGFFTRPWSDAAFMIGGSFGKEIDAEEIKRLTDALNSNPGNITTMPRGMTFTPASIVRSETFREHGKFPPTALAETVENFIKRAIVRQRDFAAERAAQWLAAAGYFNGRIEMATFCDGDETGTTVAVEAVLQDCGLPNAPKYGAIIPVPRKALEQNDLLAEWGVGEPKPPSPGLKTLRCGVCEQPFSVPINEPSHALCTCCMTKRAATAFAKVEFSPTVATTEDMAKFGGSLPPDMMIGFQEGIVSFKGRIHFSEPPPEADDPTPTIVEGGA